MGVWDLCTCLSINTSCSELVFLSFLPFLFSAGFVTNPQEFKGQVGPGPEVSGVYLFTE